jgi:colicin import membrane protein
VALSRHREAATVFYAAEDFGGRGGRLSGQEIQDRFLDRLSRVQAKDLAHDYLRPAEGPREEGHRVPETHPAPEGQRPETPAPAASAGASERKPQTSDEGQAAAVEQWRQYRESAKARGELDPEEIQRQALEKWGEYRAQELAKEAAQPSAKERFEQLREKSQGLSAEEVRRQAAERWAEQRRQDIAHPELKAERERQREAERKLDRGLDGPEIE